MIKTNSLVIYLKGALYINKNTHHVRNAIVHLAQV